MESNTIYIAKTHENSFSRVAYISRDIIKTITFALDTSALEQEVFFYIEECILDTELRNTKKPTALIFNGQVGLGVPGFNEIALIDKDTALQQLQKLSFEEFYNLLCEKFDALSGS